MSAVQKTYEGGAAAAARFYRLLDELEEHLDRGFFLSFIGKIVVDEKKIYSLLNELRALTPEAVRRGALRGAEQEKNRPADVSSGGETGAGNPAAPETDGEAQRVRDGANRYADDVLRQLEEHLRSIIEVVQRGREVIKERLEGQEVK